MRYNESTDEKNSGFRSAFLLRMSDKRKEGTREGTVVTDVGEIMKEMLNLTIQIRYVRSLF
jgi:hypothetical protein